MTLHKHVKWTYTYVTAMLLIIKYWGSTFLGHREHQDILNNFTDITIHLNPGHLYQLSIDGLNAN